MKFITKKDAILKLLSGTQDNNVLTKGHSDNDFLSRFIEQSIEDHTDTNGYTNVGDVYDDIGYAISELRRAYEALKENMGI